MILWRLILSKWIQLRLILWRWKVEIVAGEEVLLMLSFVFDKFGKVILVYSALVQLSSLYHYGFAKIGPGWSYHGPWFGDFWMKLIYMFLQGQEQGKATVNEEVPIWNHLTWRWLECVYS